MTDRSTSDGVARQLGRQVEDLTRKYRGGTEKVQLAMGHPDFSSRLYDHLDALAVEQTFRLPIIQRPPWKTVTIGGMSMSDYRKTFQQYGFIIGGHADRCISNVFTKSNKPKDVDLVLVTVAELGFSEPFGWPTYEEISEKIISWGFQFCPLEAVLASRLAYPEQPIGSVGVAVINIGVEPNVCCDDQMLVFELGFDETDGRSVDTAHASPDWNWPYCSLFVFVRPKK